MASLKENPSIVLVGSWNPAILQPNWLAKHIFNKADDEDIPVEMQFATTPGLPPRFKMRDILIVPAFDRLTLFSNGLNTANLAATESAVLEILKLLPHTPISAAGENFKFVVPEQQEVVDMLNVDNNWAEYLDFDYEQVQTEIRSTLQLKDMQLNIFRARSDSEITIHFNFHYPATDAQTAAKQLANSFNANCDFAKNILANLNVPLTDD
jgi:hypothetical protein